MGKEFISLTMEMFLKDSSKMDKSVDLEFTHPKITNSTKSHQFFTNLSLTVK